MEEKNSPASPSVALSIHVPHQYSNQYFQITDLGDNQGSVLCTKVTKERLIVRASDLPQGARLWAPVWPRHP